MNPDGVYAFIELRSADMTDLALQLDGQILHGRPMAVGRPVAKPDFRQPMAVGRPVAKPDFRRPMAVGRPVAKPDFRRMLLSAEDALGAARLLVKEFPGSPTPDLGEQFQAITGVGFQVRRTPSRWWARTGSDVRKSQLRWGRISAQMWGESRRRCGASPGADVGPNLGAVVSCGPNRHEYRLSLTVSTAVSDWAPEIDSLAEKVRYEAEPRDSHEPEPLCRRHRQTIVAKDVDAARGERGSVRCSMRHVRCNIQHAQRRDEPHR